MKIINVKPVYFKRDGLCIKNRSKKSKYNKVAYYIYCEFVYRYHSNFLQNFTIECSYNKKLKNI
jgi:hypothetical protein